MPFRRTLLLAALLVAPLAYAQDGRTDGPEGSEVGHGGYSGRSLQRFALTADFGGVIYDLGPRGGLPGGPPLYVGATASAWLIDWFLMDLHGNYAFSTQRLSFFAGPRLRTYTWPVSIGAGLRAGVMYSGYAKTVMFGLSPTVTLDMMLGNHFLFGIHGAADIPVGSGLSDSGPQFRIGLDVGWRF